MDSSKRPQTSQRRELERAPGTQIQNHFPTYTVTENGQILLRIPAIARRRRRPEGATRRTNHLQRLREEEFALATQFGMAFLLLEKKSVELGEGRCERQRRPLRWRRQCGRNRPKRRTARRDAGRGWRDAPRFRAGASARPLTARLTT